MRAVPLLLICGVLVSLLACNMDVDKIPGRYVYMAESASTQVWDTVEISRNTGAGSNDLTMIYKVTSFRKQPDGSLGESKYNCDTLAVTYNKTEHTLLVKEWLRNVPVNLKEGTLLFGESLFKKMQ
jgi:hypothetical protein